MENIDTVARREQLSPKREPYWSKLSAGVYVGYRRLEVGGTWIARVRHNGKQEYRALGDLATLEPRGQYDEASRLVREWAQHLTGGGLNEVKTVRSACEAYVAHLRSNKREKAANDAQARFANYVLDNERFASTELAKLTPAMVQAWRERLSARPVHRGSGNSKTGSKPTDLARSASSLNRDMVPVKAALNLAFEDGWVTTDFAWRNKLKPIKNADGTRNIYLDKQQRQRFIEAAPADLANFLRAMGSLPIRPGAMAELRVKDFDARLGQLSIRIDKTKSRAFTLPDGVAAFFSAMCKDKLPEAHIFARADGVAWNKDRWKVGVKAAAEAVGLPERTVLYSVRHSVITDLVRSGLDLASVAALSGTSVRMIEKHYDQHRPNRATAALAQIAAA